jgi:hypothetical protein
MFKYALGIAAALMATAASAQTFDFGSPANTSPGNDATFTSGIYSVTASGYSAPNTDAALYIKNLGGDEVGLGLTGDPSHQNEIYSGANGGAAGFIQLDVSDLLAIASGATFSMDSTTLGEQWAVYGSNTDGAGLGVLVNSSSGSNDEGTHALGGWGTYDFYNFYSLGTNGTSFGNVLLSGFAVTPSVPEPATWAMMLLGFGGIGFAMRRNRKSVGLAQAA